MTRIYNVRPRNGDAEPAPQTLVRTVSDVELVDVGDESDAGQLARLRDERRGVSFTSDANLPALHEHLRTLSSVQTESGERLFFRYYDPRVLRVFLPTCSADQLDELFGPIKTFLVDGEDDGEMFVFRRGPNGLETALSR